MPSDAKTNVHSSQTVTIIAVSMLGVVAVILAAYVFFIPASINIASQGRTSSNTTIQVSATGVANGKPSIGLISLYVNGSAATTADAVANLSATLTLLNKSIEPYINYNSSEISTQSYNVYKPYNYCNYNYPVTSQVTPADRNCTTNNNYEAQEYIYIKIPNIANLSTVLGLTASIPNVYVTDASASFSDSQTKALMKAAYADAIANATQQAQALALNHTVVLINISANSGYYYPISLYTASAPGSGGITTTVPSVPIYFGSQQVTESVQATFSYNPR